MPKINFPKLDLKFIRNLFLLIIFAALIFSGGYIFGYQGYKASVSKFPNVTIERDVPADKGTLNFSLFWRVWDALHTNYYDKDQLIESELVYGAIKGMVAAVGDPYTIFLPPSENKVVQEDLQGSFSGVGIQIGFKGSQLAVIAPLPDSPAEDAGVEAGDFIVGIIDENKTVDRGTVGITLPEAVQLIRGPAGSTVTLVLLRDGEDEPIEVAIRREEIEVPSIVLEYVGENESVAHVKLLKFSGETLPEWENAVVELLQRPNLQGIIIDVRNNPGGYLQAAVELSSDFLDQGDVVVIEEAGEGIRNEYRVETLGRFRQNSVVVIVNEGSASASEILAGAFKDNDRSQIVGQATFGKGTIQEPQQIDNGAGLHITIARWLTPSGFWVDEGGLIPDIELEDNSDTEEDEQLQEAIRILEN